MSEIKDGGPAICRSCSSRFDPVGWQIMKYDFMCKPCRREQERLRIASDKNFKEKRKAYNALPNVQKKRSEYWRLKRANPLYEVRQVARRKVRYELEAGRMIRGLCEVCSLPKTDAHHLDYSRPLDVKWLCRSHHMVLHRKSAMIQESEAKT